MQQCICMDKTKYIILSNVQNFPQSEIVIICNKQFENINSKYVETNIKYVNGIHNAAA